MTSEPGSFRIEKDTMGEMRVPADALYGASTQRAILNFPISGKPVPVQIIHAFGFLKVACARANLELGLLDEPRAEAIINAASSIAAGEQDRHFPIDVYQTGSGTSTNMNVNEVIANLICRQRNVPVGSSKDPEYLSAGGVHPNDHVNMGQSSNDTFPTAMHIAGAHALKEHVLPSLDRLAGALESKAQNWRDVIKIGRTHLQDATPIRLGQEFSGYASQIRHSIQRLESALEALCELSIGGTAVGTGINTHREFGKRVASLLAEEYGIAFREAENHYESQHAKDAIVFTSGCLKTIAASLTKIANDIRWLGSGPRCGLGEVKIPAVQPGSSIMPGKVNPVICEAVIMASCRVIGNDATITLAGLGGIGSLLDLNVAMPVMADALIESLTLCAQAGDVLRANCIEGMEADSDRCAELIEQSLAMCTSLAPIIGYDKAASIAKKAYERGKTVREVALEEKVLPQEELEKFLDPASMTEPFDQTP